MKLVRGAVAHKFQLKVSTCNSGLNITSLPRQIDELRIILHSKCLDLLAINETRLHDIIADNEVSVDG